jgi:hypothetical protein
MDLKHIYTLLEGTIHTDAQLRKQAEDQLKEVIYYFYIVSINII